MSAITSTPQVRTLLLTDLVDSTSLVERLGDQAAAVLFRAHDRIVLELQQRWRGRLIDRSDGLLLLFERPIDGLGFALDYVRGLRELGREHKQPLQARAGLHVGEVLVWENSVDAVRLGAKSLEVEGLAKPLAGRLMALARPGQILLSATAEPLAHRAARELGERGELLVWKSYGRWRFKGVPEAQEVFEVGEPGLAPLRMPAHTPKAWRDLPLWRRPAALAAETLLLAGLVLGGWFITRPQPAIAFNERDWVVVGDLRNLTGDPRLDDSLEQAFRISLEQSRYVNVLSDLKVRETLERMQKKPGAQVDRTLGSEIAQRDGARAVLLPTVAEVGGRLRVSAEVIDPRTQTTVYAVSADGRGIESALASIDDVTDQLREKLGEAMESVQKTSVPLPNVATPSLDALKAYALGRARMIQQDFKAAGQLFQNAVEIDPQFAMARASLGFVQFNLGQTETGISNIRRALSEPGRLTPREQLRLEGLMAQFGPVDELLKVRERHITLYPDDMRAQFDYAQEGWGFANRYADMLPHARAAARPMSEMSAAGGYVEGVLLLGTEMHEDALRAFERAARQGVNKRTSGTAFAYEALRRYAEADRAIASAFPDRNDPELQEFQMLTMLDRGRFVEASAAASKGKMLADSRAPVNVQAAWRMRELAVKLLAGESVAPAQWRELLSWLGQNDAALRARYVVSPQDGALGVAYLAAQAGHEDVVRDVLAASKESAVTRYNPMTVQLRQAVLSEADLAAGRAQAAVDRLSPIARGNDAIIVVRATLMRALRATGRDGEALRQARKLATMRGRAFVEQSGIGGLDPWEVALTTTALLEQAEILRKQGDKAAAQAALGRFLAAWPEGELPDALLQRVRRLRQI